MSITEKQLISEKNFKRAGEIDSLDFDFSGIYCIRIADVKKLPAPFDSILSQREHNIIYIGSAKKSLKKRFLRQELRAKGHGTFFRSLGAVLGYRPPQGSLLNKRNKYNYQFLSSDKLKIIEWINENLYVNWVDFNGDFEVFETLLIGKYTPLLNIQKNPSALPLLRELRNECCGIAKANLEIL
jgi:hypothetical protein